MTDEIMPFDRMMEFILSGKDASGDPIDVRKWLKTPLMLHEEDLDREVRLLERGARRARSARNARTRIETPKRKLLEVSRTFTLPDGKTVTLEDKKDHAASGTLMRTETSIRGAVREFIEEMGFDPGEDLEPIGLFESLSEKESSVYIGFITLNFTSNFLYLKDDSFWQSTEHLRNIYENGHVFRDKNVLIRQEWEDKK